MKIEKKIQYLEKKLELLSSRLDMLLQENKSIDQYTGFDKSVKEESSREFFLRFNPKNDTEKTLVAIKFLEKKGLQTITIKEISDTFKEMRESLPKNISDKIQLLDKRGFVKLSGQEGKRKCWIVSNTGENYLVGMIKNAKK